MRAQDVRGQERMEDELEDKMGCKGVQWDETGWGMMSTQLGICSPWAAPGHLPHHHHPLAQGVPAGMAVLAGGQGKRGEWVGSGGGSSLHINILAL